MFAVIRTGGKQYKVAKDDIISVEKLLGEPGDRVKLDDVLMLGGEGEVFTVNGPTLEKACVTAEIIEQSKSEKIIVFKKKRRHNYRRKRGHRQALTVLKVLDVSKNGAQAEVSSKKSTKKETSGKSETTLKTINSDGTSNAKRTAKPTVKKASTNNLAIKGPAKKAKKQSSENAPEEDPHIKKKASGKMLSSKATKAKAADKDL